MATATLRRRTTTATLRQRMTTATTLHRRTPTPTGRPLGTHPLIRPMEPRTCARVCATATRGLELAFATPTHGVPVSAPRTAPAQDTVPQVRGAPSASPAGGAKLTVTNAYPRDRPRQGAVVGAVTLRSNDPPRRTAGMTMIR